VGGDEMVEDYEDSEEENYMIEEQDEDEIEDDAMSEITDKELNEILNDDNVNLIESQIDPYEWKLELERVGPALKVKTKENLKDWRSKITKVNQLQTSINNVIPEVRSTLERLATELNRTTERIENRESSINMNLDDTAEEYRENITKLSALSED
jgi:chromosome segregation ATPase